MSQLLRRRLELLPNARRAPDRKFRGLRRARVGTQKRTADRHDQGRGGGTGVPLTRHRHLNQTVLPLRLICSASSRANERRVFLGRALVADQSWLNGGKLRRGLPWSSPFTHVRRQTEKRGQVVTSIRKGTTADAKRA